MKKSGITILLLLTLFVLGNAQTQPSTSDKSEGKDCHEQHSHGKKDGHHKGISLFHRHHGKGHHQSGGHSHGHHGKGVNAEKGRSRSTK